MATSHTYNLLIEFRVLGPDSVMPLAAELPKRRGCLKDSLRDAGVKPIAESGHELVCLELALLEHSYKVVEAKRIGTTSCAYVLSPREKLGQVLRGTSRLTMHPPMTWH
jgi:hypothetical protein